MKSTLELLDRRFPGGVVMLDEVSKPLFGLSPVKAREAIKAGEFPIPTFRLFDSQKGPLVMLTADLAAHIDKCRDNAVQVQESVTQAYAAGGVQ